MRATDFRRRLGALEKRGTAALAFVVVHILSFEADGTADAEISRLRCGSTLSWTWTREAGESEHAFIARARRAAPPPVPGCTLVLVGT